MQSTRYSSRSVMKFEFSRQIFEKYLNIRFNENPSSGRRFVPCERTDRRTDTTKLVVAFCNITNAPENERRYKYLTSVMWEFLKSSCVCTKILNWIGRTIVQAVDSSLLYVAFWTWSLTVEFPTLMSNFKERFLNPFNLFRLNGSYM